MLKSQNSLELLNTIKSEKLLINLIEQLNKDFLLSGISKVFDINSSFEKLNEELTNTLLNVIQFKYDEYLNLIYRIDISENEMSTIVTINLESIVNQLAFLILKREFQKVWLKQNYK